jgi:hypothetical protein
VYHNPQRGYKHAPEEETIAPLEDVEYVDDDFNDVET